MTPEVDDGRGRVSMLGYFSTRPVIEWKTPRFGDAGKGVLDGAMFFLSHNGPS